MSFVDPQDLPDPLLWLHAGRGADGDIAAGWDGATSTHLRGPSDGGVESNDSGFAFACWVRVDSRPTSPGPERADTHIAGKWAEAWDPAREWLLYLDSSAGDLQFRHSARTRGWATVPGPRSALPGGIELGRWYFVAAWHDAARKTLNLSVDGVSTAPVAIEGGIPTGWAPFHLGAAGSSTSNEAVAGHPPIALSRAAFFKDTPGGIGGRIDEIIAALHADGDGADLADLAPEVVRHWGMLAYWPLNEPGGIRYNALSPHYPLLHDASSIGTTSGPFVREDAHGRFVTRWVDQSGGRAFTAADRGSLAVWLGDQQRIRATSPGDRLEHDGLVLSGRPRWTLSVVASTRLQRGFGLYTESSGPADDEYLELRVDHQGVPELAVRRAGGPEVVARAGQGLAGRLAVSAAASDPMPAFDDGVPRARCRLTVGDGHPFATGDILLIKGLGPAFDGEHILTHATEGEIHYVVDRPQAAPATAGARRLPGGDMAAAPTATGRLDRSLDHRLPSPWVGDSWTVAGWVRKSDDGLDARAGGAGIFAAKDAWDVDPRPTRPQVVHGGDGTPGTYRLELPGGPAAAFGPAPRDRWVHLAAVRSGGTIALYYDGAPAGTLDVSADPTLGSTFTGMGFGLDAELLAALPCDVDGWGVWLGRSLSVAEVAALHGAGAAFAGLSAKLRAGLAAWYDFDEVSGDARDASGNGRHLVERGLVPSAEGVGGGIPFASASAVGLAVGTGRAHIAYKITCDAGLAEEYRRFVLTVRRDGGTVSFFRDGIPIGSSRIDPSLLGPASGRAGVLGSPRRVGAPHGSIEQVLAVGAALADDRVAGLGARLSVRVNRERGVGPLAVLFDATQIAGVDRMAAQDYHYLWAFTRAGEVVPHDDSAAHWGGQGYARSTGFFVSQVFEGPEDGEAARRYDAHLAVVTPPYDRRGRPQPQSCLFAGKVATITVDPWPDSTATYYVSSEHPARDDNGPGTSPDAPLATLGQAMARLNRPNTRILLRRGEQFPFPFLSFRFKAGPILVGAYGDPADGRPTLIPATRDVYNDERSMDLTGCYDLRVVGIAVHDTGEIDPQSPRRARIPFDSGGQVRLLLIRDVSTVGTFRFGQPHATDRACVFDRNDMSSMGDYTIYGEAAHELSMTRNAFDGEPYAHTLRFQASHRVQVAFSHRENVVYSGVSWFSLRFESCYSVVSDNIGGWFSYPSEPLHHLMTAQLGQVERNRLYTITGAGDRVTARHNMLPFSPNVLRFYDMGGARSGACEGVRLYDNALHPDNYVAREGVAPYVTWEAVVPYLVEDNCARIGAAPATVPTIGMAVAAPGAAILASTGHAAGPEPWRLRWMRRRAGVDESFEPLAGQAAAAIVDLPPSPGAYEYRLDLVTQSGVEALGAEAVAVVVPGSSSGADYILTPPSPAAGLAGAPSSPFTLALLGDAPDSPVAVTPGCDDRGRFEPARVVLSAEAPSASFRFIPTDGIDTYVIGVTNDGGLADPPPVDYVATTVVTTPEGADPVTPPSPLPRPLDPSPGADGRGRGPAQGHRGPGSPPSRPSLAGPPAQSGPHRQTPGAHSLAAPPVSGTPGPARPPWSSRGRS